jgi:hypothetical protein
MQSGVTTNYQGGRRAQTEEAARERVRESTDGKTPARLPERPEYRPLNTMPPPECATWRRVLIVSMGYKTVSTTTPAVAPATAPWSRIWKKLAGACDSTTEVATSCTGFFCWLDAFADLCLRLCLLDTLPGISSAISQKEEPCISTPQDTETLDLRERDNGVESEKRTPFYFFRSQKLW